MVIGYPWLIASAQQIPSPNEEEKVQTPVSVESVLKRAVNTKSTPSAVTAEQRGNEIILRAK